MCCPVPGVGFYVLSCTRGGILCGAVLYRGGILCAILYRGRILCAVLYQGSDSMCCPVPGVGFYVEPTISNVSHQNAYSACHDVLFVLLGFSNYYFKGVGTYYTSEI